MIEQLLSNHGVLGINARNLLYVKPFNPKKAIAFADDKLKTKAFLTARGIPAAKIFARVETREQLRSFDFSALPDECVLKPNYGFGGEGIVILHGRDKQGQFLRNGKRPISQRELVDHMGDILDGRYSLGGRRDTAFFEQLLIPHDAFAPFRPVGMPDIRVIVFNLVPVMAMLRIPTAASDGKANLHLGGMGIGIDIAKGVTTHAAQYHHMITELPHGGPVAGHQIPFWDDILLTCSKIQYITNIGYLAADITLDQQMGPALLEVNARAGLSVQIANLAPLRSRLERVQGLTVSSPEKGVRIGQELFGEKIHEKNGAAKPSDARPHLGLKEVISIAGDGAAVDEHCIIAPDRERTVFSRELIAELAGHGAVEQEGEGQDRYRVKFTLGGRKIQTVVLAADLPGPERAIIGRRDLGEFLIDPAKKPHVKVRTAGVKIDLRAVDKLLSQLDRDLLLLKHLKPVNLAEERARLAEDKRYNPIFQYAPLPAMTEIRERLAEPVLDTSPLGTLLEKKRRELSDRITLLEARGDAGRFTAASVVLFGKPTSSLIRAAEATLHNRPACDLAEHDAASLSLEETKRRFEEALTQYGLHDWQVTIRSKLVADCTVGGKHVYLRDGANFSPTHIEALIKHEIETHILTAENGEHQPYALLRRGCAGYLDTQEGLAIYNQNRVYGESHEKHYNAPRNLLSLAFATEHGFAQTRQYLEQEIGYDAEKALQQTIIIKRGLSDTSEPGAFTKSVVYYRGLRAIERFVAEDGDLAQLYVGKIPLEDIALVQALPDLQPPLLLPEFLRERPKKTAKKRKTSK
jgi:alpha-L-glutamate ligase-like protein/uncharacterized protein (TIGR02421 family)